MNISVVVVGGGPAGATTAFTLGKLGIETILIDKKPKNKIGDKVCGDALSPYYPEKANEEIGLPIPSFEGGDMDEICEIVAIMGKNPETVIEMPSYSATVDRLEYGQKLITAIEELETVTILAQTRLRDVIVENKFVKGIICHNRESGNFEIRAKLVIDASGIHGVVRKRLPEFMLDKFPRKIPLEQRFVAYRDIIETKEPHPFQKGLYISNQPELEEVGAAYYWFFSKGDRKLNIGLGYLLNSDNRGNNIAQLNESVRKRMFPDAKVIASQGDQIPCRLPLYSVVHNGFMTVGDAAGLADPINGEGHGPAIIAGVKCGEIAAEAIEKGDCSELALWKYNEWIWNKYGTKFSWGIAIIKVINKYGAELFDYLIENKIIEQQDIQQMISNPDHKIGLAKKVLRCWKRPGLLWSLYQAKKQAERIQELSKTYPSSPNDFKKWKTQILEVETYY